MGREIGVNQRWMTEKLLFLFSFSFVFFFTAFLLQPRSQCFHEAFLDYLMSYYLGLLRCLLLVVLLFCLSFVLQLAFCLETRCRCFATPVLQQPFNHPKMTVWAPCAFALANRVARLGRRWNLTAKNLLFILRIYRPDFRLFSKRSWNSLHLSLSNSVPCCAQMFESILHRSNDRSRRLPMHLESLHSRVC